MSHPIYRVRSCEIVSAYTLRIRFDDATEQTIDFRPVLAGELYGPLRDVELFNQVRIDSEVETLPGAGSASRPKLGPARSRLTRRCRGSHAGLRRPWGSAVLVAVAPASEMS